MRARLLAGAVLVALAACSPGRGTAAGTPAPRRPSPAAGTPAPRRPSPAAGTPAPRRPSPAAPRPSGPVVYVAVGASESLGVGSTDPAHDAWPALFDRASLPPSATFDNVAVSGATTQDALRAQVPRALADNPTVVTVWLNVNDLIAGVTPADYGSEPRMLVSELRRQGRTTVLVANTPPLDELPAYLACRSGSFGSAAAGICPAPSALDATVDAYNAATAEVVSSTGAILVDLHAAGLAAERAGTYASLVSGDGFHPSDAGYALVARSFDAALQAAGLRF